MITLLFLLNILFLLELMIAVLEGEWDLVLLCIYYQFHWSLLKFYKSLFSVFRYFRCSSVTCIVLKKPFPERSGPAPLYPCCSLGLLHSCLWLCLHDFPGVFSTSYLCWILLFMSFFKNFYLFVFWLFWVFVALWAFLQVRRAGGCPPVAAASLAAEHGLQCGL